MCEPEELSPLDFTSKEEARKAGCKFFIGSLCKRDPSHGGVRYSRDGRCVGCDKASQTKIKARRKAEERPRIVGMRERGVLKCDPRSFRIPVLVLGSPASSEIWLDNHNEVNKP